MFAHVVAQTASGDAPPFDIFSLLLPLALAFLIFTMFRRQRKAQKQVKEMRTSMEPGTEVMTQFGLFGTIVSIDQENNKAVLELSPGNLATVHTQALSKVVEQERVDDTREEALPGTPVAEDTSSIDAVDRTPSAGSTAAGTAGTTSGVETPEETLERLNRQSAQESRDSRDPRDPKANPDN
ncbi:preprotein translocase subunit YajC [Arthrobacter burdickii]|uniref:Preprotein translocase subunit YajC n=1 Tax=Arthrobacter burdickii TaxID=3035920 RepID=A0ABT8K5E7_9MICC|nr:preprotein translocase subunit YajC [Arthrobacter burdickii]MDN4611777.1 preprotein translocase subunit YajC [Arthrobacter burdickii]